MRTLLAGAFALALCAGCDTSRPRSPGSVCDGVPVDAGCGSGTPVGTGTSGGVTDGGGLDAFGGDAAVGSIEGEVLVPRAVPVPADTTGTSPGAGWTVRSLGAGGAVGVSTESDGSGNFALAGVEPAGESYLLELVPPAGGGTLATINEFGTLPAHYNLVGVPESTLAEAAAGAGVTLGREFAHVVFQLVDVPSVATGVSLQIADGTSAVVAYDDVAGGLTAAATATGAHGTIAVFNIAAPAGGGTLDVQLTKGTASQSYRLTVLPGRVNWVRLNAP